LLPLDAAVSQSEGSVMVARSEPESAAAQFAGGESVRISIVGAVPMVVSYWSAMALRMASES